MYGCARSSHGRASGSCQSRWPTPNGMLGVITRDGPSPIVQKAMLTPSAVFAYWMRGSMTPHPSINRPPPHEPGAPPRYAGDMRIMIAASEEQSARMAADVLWDAVAQRPDAAIGLPSGKTPLGLYDELARRVAAAAADLSGVRGFAIDELYGVSPDHRATNATYFREHVTPRIP